MPIVSTNLDMAEMQAMRKSQMTMQDRKHPTFRFSLLDGVKEGFLINPMVLAVLHETLVGKDRLFLAVAPTSATLHRLSPQETNPIPSIHNP
jgi:hypothetical protein